MDIKAEELEIEQTFSKYELLPFLKEKAKDLVKEYPELEQDISILILAFFLMEKRMKPEEIVGRIFVKYKDLKLITYTLEKLIDLNLLIFDEDRDELITAYRLSDEDEKKRQLFMYPLPMVIKPEPVRNNNDTGYIKTKYPIICRSKATHDDYNLDFINRINSVGFRINKKVLNKCKNQNKSELVTVQQKNNFKKFSDFQRTIAESYSDRIFYFTHRYDKRGRYYPTGYYLNYQGNDFAKALIEFYKGEKLNS